MKIFFFFENIFFILPFKFFSINNFFFFFLLLTSSTEEELSSSSSDYYGPSGYWPSLLVVGFSPLGGNFLILPATSSGKSLSSSFPRKSFYSKPSKYFE
jgi:hypothetical protein